MATDPATPPALDVARVVREHATRVGRSDPDVAGQDVLPEPKLGGGRFEATAGDSAAVASAVTIRTVLDSADATWGPLVAHRLRARVAGADPAGALEGLLGEWEASVVPDPEVPASEHGLVVPWSSRDTAPAEAFVRRGFAASRVLAIRELGDHDAPSLAAGDRDDVTVRRASTADLGTMVDLVAAMVAFDAQFGWIRVRDSTASKLRAQLTQAIAWDGGCIVAEVDGDIVGVVAMQPPSDTGWIAQLTTTTPVAYLAFMSVAESHRGRAVGSALAERAHVEAARWGAAAVVLHHTLPNPLSTPFWARQGYRPLVTEWTKTGPMLAP